MDIDYAVAIDNINSGAYNNEKVCVELAKIDPALFNQIVSKLSGGVPNEEERIVLDVFDKSDSNNLKVESIKAHRRAFNISLKESKERVESIMLKYKLNPL